MRQKMGMQEGVGAIGWKDIYEWYNTPEFMLINFKVKGQQGAYILPKRLDSKNFFRDHSQASARRSGRAKRNLRHIRF